MPVESRPVKMTSITVETISNMEPHREVRLGAGQGAGQINEGTCLIKSDVSLRQSFCSTVATTVPQRVSS